MSTKRLYLVILLLVIGCQQVSVSADRPALLANEAVAEAKLSKELEIYRNTLLTAKNEQMRINAASLMLFNEDPLARKILLDALKQTENTAARVAVCKALSQTRGTQKPIKNKENFIQPLLEVLTTEEDSARAKLAAEATLIFEYAQISKPLEKIITDAALPAKARLNTIYALKLHPDKKAIFKLMELLDNPERQMAAAAEKALTSLGIPIGKNPEARRQIIKEINRKGKEEFLRDWQIRQEAEAKMRKLQDEADFWQKQYLLALDEIYSVKDDTAKGKFLAEHLASSKAIVRLWALEKVAQWRVGTKSKLPDELGPLLVNLISDQNRDVRLKTAKLLSLMGQLNSAKRLLEQLKIEQDDEVRMELFVALGEACRYAFSPNSGIKISPEIRKQTLEWAVKYLSKQEPKKAQKGAEVIQKLLEQNGLASAEVDRYLGSLAERYSQPKSKADGALRGELLSAMAGLCAQSAYKDKSRKLFKPLFEEALTDAPDLVREAAVDGLINIDKTKALNILRKKDFVNDNSVIVRKKLIELAGEVGGKEDLVWLAEKIGTAAENEPVWQAMLKIFKGSKAAVLNEWIAKFDLQNTKGGLSDEQRISLLEIAERKAIGENKIEMLKAIREKFAQLYSKSGEYERAAEYLGMLRKAAQTDEEKERISAELLDVYWKWPNLERAAQLVNNYLLGKELDPNSVIVRSIDSYISEPPAGADPNAMLKALEKMDIPTDKPKWAEQVERWKRLCQQAKAPNKPKEAGN